MKTGVLIKGIILIKIIYQHIIVKFMRFITHIYDNIIILNV